MSDDVSIDEDEGGCTKADRAGQERTKKGGLEIPGEVIGTWMVLLGAELPIASSVSGGECVCACVCGRDHCWKISLYSASVCGNDSKRKPLSVCAAYFARFALPSPRCRCCLADPQA